MSLIAAYLGSTREMIESFRRKRSLFVALAKRDVSDEYVEHSLSKAWPLVHPLIVMGVYLFAFTVIFPMRISQPANLATDGVIYLMSGIVPWLMVVQVMGRSLTSVVNNAIAVKQMAFPLEFLPAKALATPLLFAAVSLSFVFAYSVYLTGGACIPAYLVGLPVLIVITCTFLLGLALLLAAVQVFLRDLREMVSIFTTVGLFIHPILYFPDAIPDAIEPVLFVSPFTYLLFCWQDVLFYGEVMRPVAWILTPIVAAVFLIVGARVFMVSKSHFGDFL